MTKKTDYDKISDLYINHVEHRLSWNNLYERPYMCSIFEDFKGKDVLDIGAATGFYSFYVQQRGANVTSVDKSQKMLNYIKEIDKKKNIGKEIKTIRADISNGLSFIKDRSQDYIICSLMIHYIEEWETIMDEFYRVLRKNGKVYLSTHNPVADYHYLEEKNYLTKKLVTDTWGSGEKSFEVKYYSRPLSEVMTPIIKSQFKIEKIEEPLPDGKCKELSPETFEYLSKNPGFLFFQLKKD